MRWSIRPIPTPSETTQQVTRLGKYELIAPIGKGGMAQVFLARQTGPLAFEKIVVVKSIHDALTSSSEFVEMLLDEARVAALIKHPNVVDIYDLGQADGKYFIAMEYISGRPLSKMLGRAKGTANYLEALGVAHIVAEAADGLHAAHSLRSLSGDLLNLVHRDVTPGNIMIAYDGGVKLVDFGVAKSLGNMNSTQVGQLKGKMGYLSPEQINGQHVSPQTDVFSLGIVLWESLVVARLFKGETMGVTVAEILTKKIKPPSHYREDVPEELDRICLKALARDPKERYQSAEEMHDDLSDLLRESNYHRGRRKIAKYMEIQFSEDIESDRKLVTQVDFSVPMELPDGAEAELSAPNSSPSHSPTVTMEEVTDLSAIITPTAEIAEGAPSASIVDKLRRAPRIVQAAIGGGALLFIIIMAVVLGGGDDTEPAAVQEDPDAGLVAVVTIDAAVVEVADLPPDADLSDIVDPVDPVTPPDPTPQVVKKTPQQKAKALYLSGKSKFARGDLSGAKRDFNASLKLRPGYGPAHKLLAKLYEKAGVKSKALKHYKKYLQSSPRAADRAKIESRIKQLGG